MYIFEAKVTDGITANRHNYGINAGRRKGLQVEFFPEKNNTDQIINYPLGDEVGYCRPQYTILLCKKIS